MNSHPFLETSDLPHWSSLKPKSIVDDITIALEKAEQNLQNIRDINNEQVTFANSIKALEQSTQILDKAWGLVCHLESVCNSEELREAHNKILPAVSEFGAKIPLDPELWFTIKAFAESKESKNLSPIDQRLFEETMKDFEEAGANLPQEKKKRLEEISSELAKVTQKFSENVLDATNA